MEFVQQWLGLVALVISIGGTFYAWLTAGSKANTKKLDAMEGVLAGKAGGGDLDQLEDKVTEHDRRIQAVEAEVKHLPDKDSVHRLEVALEQMNTKIASMAASAEATERTARRVEQFLMERAK